MTALKQKTDQTQSPLEILQAEMDPDMRAVNALILENMQSDVALIPKLASYLIAAGGKRIRPLLTLSCTSLFAGDMKRAHGLAAAVEFIHTATLLHDDVVDDSKERRGKESANVVFGNEASVLVGDFLFSRAFQLMTADGSLDVLRILSNASAVIAEGEVKQLSTQNNLSTTMDDYRAVIEGKTASLFAAACEVGPVIANQNSKIIRAMRDYGMALGMAFQIADDALDYQAERAKLGKTVGDDFREGKITAPILFALGHANDDERAFWQRTLQDRQQEEEDLQAAQEIITKHDTITKSLDLARQYGAKAITSLQILPETPQRQTLEDLVSFTINREY